MMCYYAIGRRCAASLVFTVSCLVDSADKKYIFPRYVFQVSYAPNDKTAFCYTLCQQILSSAIYNRFI
jgi:hypothetical protein